MIFSKKQEHAQAKGRTWTAHPGHGHAFSFWFLGVIRIRNSNGRI
jgi:hypothetical protein